jgi:hypothetical protein
MCCVLTLFVRQNDMCVLKQGLGWLTGSLLSPPSLSCCVRFQLIDGDAGAARLSSVI